MNQLDRVNRKHRVRRWFSATLITAVFVSLVLIWQIVEISSGGELSVAKMSHRLLGFPGADAQKTKTTKNARVTVEPVAAFLGRAKRGMSGVEIDRMIEDFEKIGEIPRSGNSEDLREYGEKQNEWYLAALSEALSLSTEQKRDVQTSLKESLRVRLEAVEAAAYGPLFLEINFNPKLYLHREDFAPWKLCDLTEAQLSITMERWWKSKREEWEKSEITVDLQPSWLGFSTLYVQDPRTGEVGEYPPLSDTDSDTVLHDRLRGGMMDISMMFPLTPDQNLMKCSLNMLAQAKLLHPAQLRMALFRNPSLAKVISAQLWSGEE